MGNTTSVGSCCQQLQQIPGLSIAFSNQTSYVSTQAQYWSLQETTHISPSCIVKPQSAADVSSIIRIIGRKGNECKAAIKGQGHAPAAGFANVDGGVTMDMTGLNSASVSEDGSVVQVGAGASWLDVYAHLDSFNKTVAGGRNGAVGVGGLTVGGGISYFSPQVGFTCDTVRNYEVVLASGELVNANASHHPDLFRALKGGLNNLGIVTRFDFATVPYEGILGGSIAHDIALRDEVFKSFAVIADAKEYDVHASLVTSLLFNGTAKSWTLQSTPAYTKPELKPKVYEELFAIPTLSNELHLTKISPFANESALPPLNWLFETVTLGVSETLLGRMFDAFNVTLQGFNPAGTTLWSIAIEPLPSVIAAHGAGKNALGTTEKDGNGVVVLISAFWTDSSATEAMMEQGRSLAAQVRGLAREMELERRFVYANYAGPEQKPLESYGEENVQMLKRVAGRYDPGGFFQTKVPGGFKLM